MGRPPTYSATLGRGSEKGSIEKDSMLVGGVEGFEIESRVDTEGLRTASSGRHQLISLQMSPR